jgi:hypothetical protein
MRRVLLLEVFAGRLSNRSLRTGTNEDWQASFVDSARVIHKLVDLKNFAIYWDSAAPPLRFDHIQVRQPVCGWVGGAAVSGEPLLSLLLRTWVSYWRS